MQYTAQIMRGSADGGEEASAAFEALEEAFTAALDAEDTSVPFPTGLSTAGKEKLKAMLEAAPYSFTVDAEYTEITWPEPE